MIEILLGLVVFGLMIGLFCLGFVLGRVTEGTGPIKIGRQTIQQVDAEVDHYAELQRMIIELVDKKK